MTRNLILIPTQLERDVLQPQLDPVLKSVDRVELSGFGLVAAAARAGCLIESLKPERVMLVGIAGTYSDDLPVGSAACFNSVACYGIGAGTGSQHQTVGEMGWNHIGGRRGDKATGRCSVSDTIAVNGGMAEHSSDPTVQLLSVTAAAATAEDVHQRLQRFPKAAAEDMEGFAIAMACQLADVSLSIVRGISNRAGDRNITQWQIQPSLESAANLTRELSIW